MSYPVIPYKPELSGETDQPLELQLVDLEKISCSGYMRVVHHGGERGFHIKLVLNNKEAVSLFIWNNKLFQHKNTLLRSYGVIPIEEIEIDPEEGDELVAEGSYELKNGVLTLRVEKSWKPDFIPKGIYTVRLRLKGIKEYISQKHGHSTRPEYLAIALK